MANSNNPTTKQVVETPKSNKRFVAVPHTNTDDELILKNDNEKFQHNGVVFVLKKGERQEVPSWFFEQHPDYLKYEVK